MITFKYPMDHGRSFSKTEGVPVPTMMYMKIINWFMMREQLVCQQHGQ